MEESTYDKIYGMDLNSYCAVHHTTVEQLISKVKTDIKILKGNFKTEYTGMIPTPLGDEIYTALNKKQKHLDRLLAWKGDKVKFPSRSTVFKILVEREKDRLKESGFIAEPKVPDQKTRRANRYAIGHTEKEFQRLKAEAEELT